MWMQVFRFKKKTYINKLMKVSGHCQATVESFCNIDLQHRICKISERERERAKKEREPAGFIITYLVWFLYFFDREEEILTEN